MLLKCDHYLHPMAKSKVGCVNQIINVDFNLDIFWQTPSTSKVANTTTKCECNSLVSVQWD
jgi:hypothetical protein